MKKNKLWKVTIITRSPREYKVRTVGFYCPEKAEEYIKESYTNKLTGEIPTVKVEEINDVYETNKVRTRCGA